MSNETKVTAVEWLVKQIWKDNEPLEHEQKIIEQAQALEKQQIIDAYHVNPLESKFQNCGLDYYTDTYKP
jgi:hypothetical protein